MTHSDLKHQIQGIIRNITGKEFTGAIIIHDLQPQGYMVAFEAEQYHPVSIGADLPDDKFLCFMEKELKKAKFLRIDYRKAVRNTTLDRTLNSFVSPYDTTRINR